MPKYFSPAVYGRVGMFVTMLVSGSLSGCQTEPAFQPDINQAVYWPNLKKSTAPRPAPDLDANTEVPHLPIKGQKAACNKPYRMKGKTYYPMKSAQGYKKKGVATWYGATSGNRTASGDPFNPKALSAAHKTLPIHSKVRVTNLRNGRSIDVLINDRGPFRDDKLIDLSRGAAERIGISGIAEVEVEYIGI